MTEVAPQLRQCPRCEYDMLGVPGLRCPECGKTWEEAQLVVRPKVDDGWPANNLLVFAVIVNMASQVANTPTTRLGVIGAAWAMAASWVWLRRKSIVSNKPWLLWWLVFLGANTSAVGEQMPGLSWLRWTPLLVLVVVVVFGLLVSARRFLVGTGVSSLWITGVIGALGVLIAFINVAFTHYESESTFLWIDIGDASGNLMVLGLGFGMVSIGVIGLVLVRRSRRPRPIRRP